jgi:Fe-S cluster biogenesis protein NfuA
LYDWIISITFAKIHIMLSSEKEQLLQAIDSALDAVRPHLAVDGGNVEVVDVTEEGIVQVKWLGNCQNCNMSIFTMRAGVEQAIRSRVPEIAGVEAVN